MLQPGGKLIQVAGARVGGGKKEEKEEGRTKDPD
jgi:hypothetical protein